VRLVISNVNVRRRYNLLESSPVERVYTFHVEISPWNAIAIKIHFMVPF